jgi:hypothetical protein
MAELADTNILMKIKLYNVETLELIRYMVLAIFIDAL